MLLLSKVKVSVLALVVGIATTAWVGPMQGWAQQRTRTFQRFAGQMSDAGRVTLPAGARLVWNVAYGSDPMQRMDVYIPRNVRKATVLLMVHGGGWARGDKAHSGVVQNKINYFLPKGYIFVSINYRMVPQVGVMAEAADVAQALAFVQQHVVSWGGDPARVVLMGHSAGAHLVALVSSAPSIWKSAGAKPWLGTIALDSAAYNVVKIMSSQHLALYDRAFGQDRELWKEASPTLRIESAPPPMLLVCSSLRATSCAQARAFAEKAESVGGRVKVDQVDLRHQQINEDVGLPGQYTEAIDSYLNSLEPVRKVASH